MIVAGIGCRKDVDTDSVLEAISVALADAKLPPAALVALATVPAKADEAAIFDAAARLSIEVIVVDESALAEAATRCLTHSARSYAATDTPSAAEAAAMAAAGPGAQLMGPRIAVGPVTCALALSGDMP